MNISGNLLGGEVIQKFAELIEHNKTLKRLDYTDDSLTQFDIDTLLKSLTKNQLLETLTLPEKFKVEDTDKESGVIVVT